MYVGQAGWSIYKAYDAAFPGDGTHLERYARGLNAVEINTSFYRPHQPKTYAKWAASVPAGFRFAVKAPKALTHDQRLRDPRPVLEPFYGQIAALGEKRGPVLYQLPPSLAFDEGLAGRFFEALRALDDGPVVLEPRHASWFTPHVDARLKEQRVGRVAADPAKFPGAERPGGDLGLVYYRWHGSPRMYYSDYPPEALAALRAEAARLQEAWINFDNTAAYAAMGHALAQR
jgi:uncharacterized protein YecE (DUF72 family)